MAELLIDLLTILLPAALVVLVTWLMMRSFTTALERKWQYDVRKSDKTETLTMRLQAYERLTLLTNRIAPASLLARVQEPSMTAQDLKSAVARHIQAEFEHNLTQRIYVSESAWQAVNAFRNEILKVTAESLATLPEGAMGIDLAEAVLKAYIEDDDLISADQVIVVMKNDLQRML